MVGGGRFKRKLEEVYRLSGSRPQYEKVDSKEGEMLVPVFVGLIKDGAEVREELLWHCGDKELTHSKGATRFCSEMNLPSNFERLVAEQIGTQVLVQDDFGEETLVQLEMYVRRGNLVYRDEIDWDMNNIYNLPHQYASRICVELDLDVTWFTLIDKELVTVLKNTREELFLRMETLSSGKRLTSIRSILKNESELGAYKGPRVEDYNPLEDPTSRREEIRKKVMEVLHQDDGPQDGKIKIDVEEVEDRGGDGTIPKMVTVKKEETPY